MESNKAAPSPPVTVAQDAAKGSILRQITALYGMSIKELRERYQALFPPGSSPPPSKQFLIRRIAYKLQEDAFGGLAAPAREKLETLKTELNPLKDLGRGHGGSNHQLPLPGTVITKTYKGRPVEVKILQKGFEYDGKPYKSLSRIAREVTGVHQSGFVFFGL